MAKKDYYKILEVKKTDSEEVIKQSYKRLALKFHPDKIGEDKKKEYEDNFKKINEAYSVIGDKEKRRRYDMGETSQFNQGSSSSFRGGDFSDIFADLLRNSSFGDQFSGHEDSQVDQDLQYRLTIEFNEAVFGCEKEVSIKRDVLCDSCGGSGSEGDEFESCSKCNGNGRIKVNQRSPWGVISQVIRCDECDGEGKVAKNICKYCGGSGIQNKKEKIKIKIPQGIDSDQTLRISGAGNAAKNGSKGDLFLTIRVHPHKVFKRKRFDVYMDFPISFSQAALGGEIKIPTLSSEEIKIKIKKGTESRSVLRLKGKGIPFLDDPFYKGDQFINILVKTPKKLTKAQVKLFKELAKLD